MSRSCSPCLTPRMPSRSKFLSLSLWDLCSPILPSFAFCFSTLFPSLASLLLCSPSSLCNPSLPLLFIQPSIPLPLLLSRQKWDRVSQFSTGPLCTRPISSDHRLSLLPARREAAPQLCWQQGGSSETLPVSRVPQSPSGPLCIMLKMYNISHVLGHKWQDHTYNTDLSVIHDHDQH